jgi:ABC-type sugar transport system ATPase subunit
MMTAPKVFLCDEPTQAVDVKTRGEIHRLLRRKADEGCAVVFVSSDLNEVLEMADTIQVMRRGCTAQRFKNENLTAQQVLFCCYET